MNKILHILLEIIIIPLLLSIIKLPEPLQNNPTMSRIFLIVAIIILIFIDVPIRLRNMKNKRIRYLASHPKSKHELRGRDIQIGLIEKELWKKKKESRLVIINGEAGIGKTALASQYVQTHKKQYKAIMWQPMVDAPSMKEVINGWINILNVTTLDTSLISRIDFFIENLKLKKVKKALIVFDNLESIFETDLHGRAVPPEEFLLVIKNLLQCDEVIFSIIITSEIGISDEIFLEYDMTIPFVCKLSGLEPNILKQIVRDIGYEINDKILNVVSGNPGAAILLTKLSLTRVINDEHQIAGRGLKRVMDNHISSLCKEQYILLGFLSIIHSAATINDIKIALDNILLVKGKIPECLSELKTRSLVEEVQNKKFVASSIVAEVMVETIITELIRIFTNETLEYVNILKSVPLEFVQWPETFRNNSKIFVFNSASKRLKDEIGLDVSKFNKDKIEHLFSIISSANNILCSNIVSFLISQNVDFTDVKFEAMELIGIDFSQIHLFNVNMEKVKLNKCRFSDRIGSVYSVKTIDASSVLVGLASGGVEIRKYDTLERQERIESHSEPVRAVTYIPNRNIIVSGGEDGRINIYDKNLKKLLKSWKAHDCWIWNILTYNNGDIIITIGSDSRIGLIDAINFTTIGHVRLPSVRLWKAIVLEETLYVTSEDGVLWASSMKTILDSIKNDEPIKWINVAHVNDPIKACCAINKNVIFGCRNGNVFCLDVVTNKCELLSREDGCVRDICQIPNSSLIVTVGDTGMARVYDVIEMKMVYEYRAQSSRTWSVDIYQNGDIITVGDDRTIRKYNIFERIPVTTILGNGQSLRGVDFNANEISFACADDFLRTGQFIVDNMRFKVSKAIRKGKRILGVVNLINDKTVYCFEDGEIHIYAAENLIKKFRAHSGAIESVARTTDKEMFATGGEDRNIKIYDAEGNIIKQLRGLHTSRIWKLAFSPNGKKLASAGGDFIVAIWDVKTGNVLSLGRGHNNLVLAICWLNEDEVASSGTDGTIRIWKKGNCIDLVNTNAVIRELIVTEDQKIYGVGRRSDYEPGWVLVCWDRKKGSIKEYDLKEKGGTARTIFKENMDFYIGGDRPVLLQVDSNDLHIKNVWRIPGPYNNSIISKELSEGTDLESVEILGAKLT